MALLFPAMLPTVKGHGGLFRELDVLERLTHALPDTYTLFHSLALHTIHDARDRYGEVDIVVVGPTGNVLLVEVKAGALVVKEGTLYKLYATKEHDVARQSTMQHAGFVSRLKQCGLRTSVATCVVLPDYRLKEDEMVSLPRERIIDAADFADIGNAVKAFLIVGEGCATIDKLHHFLCNAFHAHPDMAVLRGQLQSTVQQLSDGLSTWVPRITTPSGILRVQATAGSGKTQLAITLISAAVAVHKTVGYICFNRPLADYVRRLVSPKAQVANFHELCFVQFRRNGGVVDFSAADGFTSTVDAFIAAQRQRPPDLDVLIIDEGQDFDPAWVESLCSQLKPDGRFYLMEDNDQRLYARDSYDLSDAVDIIYRDNFRSPRALCELCNILNLVTPPIQSRNPYRGTQPGFFVYRAATELVTQTGAAVSDLLARGFALADIAIIVCKGRDKSVLLGCDAIGPYTTRRFTGKFTSDGDPIWTKGELLMESVFRYKGQSAPAIILSEVDAAVLTDLERRKLFVGITRAQMALEIVLTEEAEAALANELSISA